MGLSDMSSNSIKKDKDAEAESSSSFIFTAEIMIEARTNGLALEKLLRALNAAEITDYQILKGIEIGKQLEESKSHARLINEIDTAVPDESQKNTSPSAPGPDKDKNKNKNKDEDKDKDKDKAEPNNIAVQIQYYKEQGTLVRLFVVKGKGIRLSIPCRILNFDVATNNISVYHVDEKKTYLFKLNEIDDLVSHS